MKFYVGLYQPCDTHNFDRFMLSVNRLTGINRRHSMVKTRPGGEWIMDSGAFTRITSGKGHLGLRRYAEVIKQHTKTIGADQYGKLAAAVSQDWMCEPFVLDKTGLSVEEHQRLTTERYEALKSLLRAYRCETPIMPVIQGYGVSDYVTHLETYDLEPGQWVGVGSVCKRNTTDPGEVLSILRAIKRARPDLRLHGFGLKKTFLKHSGINHCLYSADSMAWSYHVFKNRKENRHDYRHAKRYAEEIDAATKRESMLHNDPEADPCTPCLLSNKRQSA